MRFFLACLTAQLFNRFLQRRVVYPIQEWAANLPNQERLWVRLLMQGRVSNLRSIGHNLP